MTDEVCKLDATAEPHLVVIGPTPGVCAVCEQALSHDTLHPDSGWMHSCRRQARQVWWPIGVRSCYWCGEEFS